MPLKTPDLRLDALRLVGGFLILINNYISDTLSLMKHTNPTGLDKSIIFAVKLSGAIDTTFQWEKWLLLVLIIHPSMFRL